MPSPWPIPLAESFDFRQGANSPSKIGHGSRIEAITFSQVEQAAQVVKSLPVREMAKTGVRFPRQSCTMVRTRNGGKLVFASSLGATRVSGAFASTSSVSVSRLTGAIVTIATAGGLRKLVHSLQPFSREWFMVALFLRNYGARHRHPANIALHVVGLPLTFLVSLWFVGTGSAGWGSVCFLVGYGLQFLGHAIEGNDAGETVLVKKWLGLPYVAIAPRNGNHGRSD